MRVRFCVAGMHGWSLNLSASRINTQTRQGPAGGQEPPRIDVRGQRGFPEGFPRDAPFLPPQPPRALPNPGIIRNPGVNLPRDPQGEFLPPIDLGSPFQPGPPIQPGALGPPEGPLAQGPPSPTLPGGYYPQQPMPGNFYPQQGPQPGGPQGPMGPPLRGGPMPGGFNAQGTRGTIPGVPGSYVPQDPDEYGTQFFNRALQGRYCNQPACYHQHACMCPWPEVIVQRNKPNRFCVGLQSSCLERFALLSTLLTRQPAP